VPKNPTSTRWSAIIATTAVIFLLDWFYLAYITSKGFQLKTYEFALGALKLFIPLQWLPVAGVVLVSFVTWYEVSFTIFPRRAAPEHDTLSNVRLMRVILLSLAAFVCVLYIPYIFGSDWFWARMSSVSSLSQIRNFGVSLLNTDQELMGLDQIWQYSMSQSAALIAMSSFAWIFGRIPKRVRK